MTVGYDIAVIIISLALFGAYCLAEEMWHCRRHSTLPTATILLIVQNAEYEIEQLIRAAALKTANSEIIIIDIASNDMTRPILLRLAQKHSSIRILRRDTYHHAIADGIALASGSSIHIYDTVHRISTEETIACLEQLARTT